MVASLIPPALFKRQRAYGAAYALAADKLAFADPGGIRLGVDEGAMSATFRITTTQPDRVGDVVESKGIFLGSYQNNPIWLLNHQSEGLPIGKARSPEGQLCVFPAANETVATCFFSQRTKDAEQVFALVAEDILRATSIGFNPLTEPTVRGRGERNPNSTGSGLYFPQIDLLEISIVCIPCQPQATLLRSHLSRGKIAGFDISERLRKSLTPFAEPAPVQVAGGFAAPSLSPAQSQPTSRNAAMSKKWAKYKSKREKHRMSQTQTIPDIETKREFSQKERDDAADSGAALPDGSFPIHNASDLKNALQAVGRAKDQAKVRRHISKRARALGLQHLLPDDWNEREGGSGASKKDDKKSETPEVEKAMSESSGTAGGYAVKDGDEEMEEETKEFVGQEVGEEPQTEEEEENEDEDEEDGTPVAGPFADLVPEGADNMAKKELDEHKRKAQVAYHLGRGKGYQAVYRHLLSQEDAGALAASVQEKAAQIAAEYPELSEEQREAIGMSLCGEKAINDYGQKAAGPSGGQLPGEQAVMGQQQQAVANQPIPEEDSSTVVPPSLKLCQQIGEIIEASLPGLEPETSDFWGDILDFIEDHGAERYPDAFPDEEDDEDDDEDGNTADIADQDKSKFADEVSAAYRKKPSKRLRRLVQKMNSALRRSDHPPIIKAAADFCHEMSTKALGYTFNQGDKAMMKEHGRNLDRVHGAIMSHARPGAVDSADGDGDDASGTIEPVAKSLSLEHPDTDNLFLEAAVTHAVEKAMPPVTANNETLKRLDGLRDSLMSIFGTRF